MRILILLLFSVQCFGQYNSAIKTKNMPHYATDTTIRIEAKDTMNAPLVSIKESMDFLKSINEKLMAMKTLNLIQDREYNELVKELNRIVAILEKKKKAFK